MKKKVNVKPNKERTSNSTQGQTPNILLMIADDLGEDLVNIGFKLIDEKATRVIDVLTRDDDGLDIYGSLPNISRFLRNGLYFSQAWAQPACSTTRASIFTGLHPWKNGVGSPPGLLDSKKGFKML